MSCLSMELGGHDCEFVEDVPDHLLCIVCLGAFKDPHLLSCCGKKVCHLCITRIKNEGQPCPHCREPAFNTMLDKDFNRQVLNLQVYCSKKDDGCNWKGDLRRLDAHLENVCLYVEVTCKWNCGFKLSRQHIGIHEEDECPLRPPEVKLTRKVMKMEERLVKLETVCKDQKQEIAKLKEELEGEKEKNQGDKKALEEKLEKQKKEFVEVITKSKEERERGFQDTKQQIEESRTEINVLRAHVKKESDETMASIKEETAALKKMNDELTERLRTSFKILQEKRVAMKEEIKQDLAKLNDTSNANFATKLSVRRIQDILERMSRHGIKVPDWQQPVPVPALTDVVPCQFTMFHFNMHKSGQKTWYSPPFFNEPGGYKFCLRVDSNGMLEGKATHLSVWVYVMRGLHDEALKWPFTGKVTVQLLNWKGDRGHIQNIIAFDDQAGDKVRQRVTAGECAATGRGSSRFVAHEALLYNQERNTVFVKDECLCFKILKIDIS